jgi:signal transduction histidine kinase
MNFRFSLRYRVALAFLMLSWLISMAMGGTLYWLTISIEEELIEETLSSELEDYINRYTLDPNIPPPSSAHIKGYVIAGSMPDTFPAELQHLPSGLSHITMNGSGYYVELREHKEKRFFVLYADEVIKQRENEYLGFLALGIGMMTLLSSTLGLWLAGQVILPVTQLAQQVSEMGPDFSPLPRKKDLPHDEVGELSQAIDGYHQRLAEFNERERAFTSNVSHELRTPLAVIKGASEVMLSGKELDKVSQKRVERIARAATQITRLTTALLTLAREESDNDGQYQCPVDKILNQVMDEHQYLLNHKTVKVELNTDSKLIVSSDPILLYVVLANLIRNAFSYTSQGTVHIHLRDKHVVIEDTGAGMKEDQLLKMFDRYYSNNQSNGGHGIGLSLVRRICERYGWEISVHSHEGRGTSVKLLLS